MRGVERDGRRVCRRDHVSRSGHVRADQGFGAHRMEKRREDGVHGQALGDGGSAGLCPTHERGDGRATGQQKRGKRERAARICKASTGLLLIPSTMGQGVHSATVVC
jgi:hypothetical protein